MINTVENKNRINFKNFNILLLGYVLYSSAYAFKGANPPYFLILTEELIQFIGLCLFSFAIIASIRLSGTRSGYLKLMVSLCIIWFYFLIIWGLPLNYDFIKGILFAGDTSLFTYILPLVILLPNKLQFLKRIKIAIILLGIFYLLFLITFRDSVFKVFELNNVSEEKYVFEYGTKWFSIASGFIILAYPYFTRKVKMLALTVVLATLIIATFRARRALMFMSFMPLLMASFLYIIHSKNKLLVLLATLILSAGLAGVGYKFYMADESGFFNTISQRGDEDTRSNVEECLYNDFEFMDWLIGRGFDGRYFCPNIDDHYEVVGYRSMIETDYLQIILKSGSIYLILLLLIFIPAAFYGCFRSKNILSKAAGFWILFWIVCLYPANVFAFSMNYLLVWVSVGLCYSKRIRKLPEAVLKRYFALN